MSHRWFAQIVLLLGVLIGIGNAWINIDALWWLCFTLIVGSGVSLAAMLFAGD